jgi:predicted Zn-dependent protease
MQARPDVPDLFDTHAQVLAALGRLPEAERQAARAVALRPRDPALRLNLLQVLIEGGRVRDAQSGVEELDRIMHEIAYPRRDHVERLAALRARLSQLSASVGERE